MSALTYLMIGNYVLMDTPDLPGTIPAFHRVLKPNGVAILVFSHPCFPQMQAPVSDASGQITHRLNVPYFEPHRCIDPPCAHFTAEFICFHRPLSDSGKARMATAFVVTGVEEPRVTPAGTISPRRRETSRTAKLIAIW
jgi:hypothetical protein